MIQTLYNEQLHINQQLLLNITIKLDLIQMLLMDMFHLNMIYIPYNNHLIHLLTNNYINMEIQILIINKL